MLRLFNIVILEVFKNIFNKKLIQRGTYGVFSSRQ